MLLEFKMKNVKSFKEEMDFKMIPTQIKDLEYSLINKKVNKKNVKALSSAVIYGPNSAGKTNIIGGMEVFRSIILNGNIKNKENITSPNVAIDKLELIPNVDSAEEEPVCFYIKCIAQELLIELTLEIKIGAFFRQDYDRKIVSEKLVINNQLIYERKEDLKIGKIDTIKKNCF